MNVDDPRPSMGPTSGEVSSQPALGPAVRAAAVLARPRLGWAAAILGVLALVVAWVGAADEVFVSRQIPYLISGGLGGLGLIVLGGVLLSTHDLYRYAERLDRMERKVDDIHRVLVEAWDMEPVDAATAAEVVALPRGTTYHRPGCAAVQGKDATHIDVASATGAGLLACKLCSPNGLVAATQ